MKQIFKSSLTGFLGSLFLLTASTLGASGASAEEYNADVGQHKDSGVPENHAVDEVLNFVEGAGTENPYFNTKAAQSAGASSETLEAGAIFNEMAASPSGVSPQNGIPVWGNYCGPFHGGSGLPIDVLDSYCQMHDRCYAELGYLNCVCDATLVALINNNLDKMSSNARPVAIAISAYFTVSPCVN